MTHPRADIHNRAEYDGLSTFRVLMTAHTHNAPCHQAPSPFRCISHCERMTKKVSHCSRYVTLLRPPQDECGVRTSNIGLRLTHLHASCLDSLTYIIYNLVIEWASAKRRCTHDSSIDVHKSSSLFWHIPGAVAFTGACII